MKCEQDHMPNSYAASTTGITVAQLTRPLVGLLAVFSEAMKPS